MQSNYAERFERDMGCSETEWLGGMTRSIGEHTWRHEGNRIVVNIGNGTLTLTWEPLPERRIALLVVKRLRVRFAFDGLDAAERLAFMKPFDLSMQRGGG